MKRNFLSVATTIFLLFFTLSISAQQDQREYYQIKTYTFDSETQEGVTDNYLQNAYLPALKRQGISNIGVFKLRSGYNITANKTYVLIPFSNLELFNAVSEKLAKDAAYLEAGKEYLEASHDKAPYSRVSSTLLRAFKDMPKMKPSALSGERKDRVYELRSYEGPNETYYQRKVHMFNEGGEITLFDDLGFNAVFYGDVISGDKMPNLMYMTTFKDMETRNALWKDFVDADKWKEISVLPQYKNTVSHADIMLLYPTDYSDY
ncbi:NIPSNAP family protein [Muriicola sp. Z0-33]|uniref:NIPSNAP family protein n=1 Tax=Muriicola sp. Z0-33 TaxID=2816957 RepID=UPI0022388AC0|nr:NIPSNAP family protein [Muriicola sp. Z0-33]MCW5518043.1 NIPSNAP family protein [Muriicola sp. Z0-33]